MTEPVARGARRRVPPWAVPALFALALGLRIAVAAWQGIALPPAPGTDEQEYVTYGWNLATLGEYRGMSPDVADQDHLTAYRTPGTSLTYAALFRVFGRRFEVLRIVNCIWGALACLVLLAIGREVAGDGVAWLAAVGWAVYPRALLFSASLGSESLGLLVFLWFILLALRFGARPRTGAAIIAGLVLGAAILVHPARLFMVPFIVLWAVIHFWRRPRALLQALWIGVMAAAVVLPWSVRNYFVFHHVIPLSTGGGSALLQGNNRIVVTEPEYFGYSVWDTAIPEYADTLRHAGNEFTRDKIAGGLAVTWLKSNTAQWPFLIREKLIRGFTPLLQARTARLYRLTELFTWGPVLLLLVVGFVPTWIRAARRNGGGWIIHLAILHFAAVTVLFFGYSRYRYPVEPLCVLIAAMTVMWIPERRRATAPAP